MNTFINFKDKGCQGAIDILKNTRSLILGDTSFEKPVFTEKRLLYVVPVDIKERIFIKINYYKEISDILGINYRIVDIDATIDKDDIVILDSHYLDKIEDIRKIGVKKCLIEDSKADFINFYAISLFTSLVYTSLRTDKNFEDISIKWLGDAGNNYNFSVQSLLNASICMKNYLAFAFEDNKENINTCMPHKENLAFAMDTGAKIFLTHDISMLDDADIVYIAHWTSINTEQEMAHPFMQEEINKDYGQNSQIISFIPNIKSSSINEDLYNNVALNVRLVTLAYLLTN